jgi:prophage maintenance system killer protein
MAVVLSNFFLFLNGYSLDIQQTTLARIALGISIDSKTKIEQIEKILVQIWIKHIIKLPE